MRIIASKYYEGSRKINNIILRGRESIDKSEASIVCKLQMMPNSDFVGREFYVPLNLIISSCNALKDEIQELRKYELRTLKYLKSLDECQVWVDRVRSAAIEMIAKTKNLNDVSNKATKLRKVAND